MSTTRRHRGQQMRIGSTALATIPLFLEDEQGTLSPVGPLQSLGMLLEEQGEVSEQAIAVIANSFDNPSVVTTALSKLGAIRVRKPSGEVVFRLDEQGGAHSSDGKPVSATSGPGKIVSPEGTASMSVGFSSSGSALDNYDRTGNLGVQMTWRQAARLGVPYGAVPIVKDAHGTPMVSKSEVDKVLSSAPRGGGVGAGKRVADKLAEATDQRSDAHKAAVRARKASQASRKVAIANAKPTPGSTAH